MNTFNTFTFIYCLWKVSHATNRYCSILLGDPLYTASGKCHMQQIDTVLYYWEILYTVEIFLFPLRPKSYDWAIL